MTHETLCPFCSARLTLTVLADRYVGSAWSGRCACGGSYSAPVEVGPVWGFWTPARIPLDVPSARA
jgi:hypothetical protein